MQVLPFAIDKTMLLLLVMCGFGSGGFQLPVGLPGIFYLAGRLARSPGLLHYFAWFDARARLQLVSARNGDTVPQYRSAGFAACL